MAPSAGPIATLLAVGLAPATVGAALVAIVGLACLVASLVVALRVTRDLRATAQTLQVDLRALLATLEQTRPVLGAELERVDDLLDHDGPTYTAGPASRAVYATLGIPLIKVMAISRGTSRASQRLRTRGH